MPRRRRFTNTAATSRRSSACCASSSTNDASVTASCTERPTLAAWAAKSGVTTSRKRFSMARTMRSGGVASGKSYVSGKR